MSNDLFTQLNALLFRWNTIAVSCNLLEDLEENAAQEQIAYLAGIAFGMETACEDLSVALAKALSESTKLEPSLM